MADQVALAARPRAGSGKGEARALRRAGRVPAIAYGADTTPTAMSVDALELYHVLHTDAGANAVIRLALEGGDTHLALARQIQRHPVRRDVLHVDFVTVNRNVRVTVEVPVVLVGEAPGTEENGVVEHTQFTVSLEVLPLEVPDSIELDISSMQVGDVLRIADLPATEGVTYLGDPEAAVVSVVIPTLDIPETEAEGEAEGAEDQAEGATGDDVEAAQDAAEDAEG